MCYGHINNIQIMASWSLMDQLRIICSCRLIPSTNQEKIDTHVRHWHLWTTPRRKSFCENPKLKCCYSIGRDNLASQSRTTPANMPLTGHNERISGNSANSILKSI